MPDKIQPVKITGTDSPIPVTVESPLKHDDGNPIPVTNIIREGDTPMPVNIVETTKSESKIVHKDEKLTLEPNTTEQQDITTEGQRIINLIWEKTQSRIAFMSVLVGMAVNAALVFAMVFSVASGEISIARLAVITSALASINLTTGIVIGFYFSRTNHTKVGGVGSTEGKER